MKRRVLVFPASQQIYESLKYNINFEVYGASGKRWHSDYIYPKERLHISKNLYITFPGFVDYLNRLLDNWKIDFIIPTDDSIAKVLMEHEENIHATIICSPVETTVIAENKALMYEHLGECEYYPKVYCQFDDIEYPVFFKPNISAGGKGTLKIDNEDELKKAINERQDYLLYEYLPGEEYTVDCFTASTGELLFIGPRTRHRITNGITYHSERIHLTDEIKSIAEDLNHRFRFRGAWFFQVKEDKNGKLKFMEFSVRQANAASFYRQLGVNFSLLSLFDFMGYTVKILYDDIDLELDRGIETLYHLSYDYDTVYIDFDDTLIINDKVNTLLIMLIYQMINKGKKIILLTKHIGDLSEVMHKYRIPENLFDKIILIKPDECKSDYIKHETKAIFIDNYFPEREDVYLHCKIPVFNLDAIECLLEKD